MTDSRPILVSWATYSAGKFDEWKAKGSNLEAPFIYSEGSDRMSAIGIWPIKWPVHADCSAFVTWLHFLSGCPDPNGLNYNHEGYTGTLLNHNQHVALFKKNAQGVEVEQIQPGDLVVYGPGEGEHVAIIVEVNGPDILTVSHGGPTGQSPTFCWVNAPKHGNPHNYPVDGRQPQTFLRTVTTQVRAPHPVPAA
jgi:CHAP domain